MATKTKRVDRLTKSTFIFICRDGDNAQVLRGNHLFGHLDHIEKHNDLYRVAGPIKNNEKGILGSCFIIAADNEQEARDILYGDPYMSCGLFESIQILPFIPSCGEWMGGITWDQDEVRADIGKFV